MLQEEKKVLVVEKPEGFYAKRLDADDMGYGGNVALELSDVIRKLMLIEEIVLTTPMVNPFLGQESNKVFIAVDTPKFVGEDGKNYRVKTFALEGHIPLIQVTLENAKEIRKRIKVVSESTWNAAWYNSGDTVYWRREPDLRVFLHSEDNILKVGFNSVCRFAVNTPEFEVVREDESK